MKRYFDSAVYLACFVFFFALAHPLHAQWRKFYSFGPTGSTSSSIVKCNGLRIKVEPYSNNYMLYGKSFQAFTTVQKHNYCLVKVSSTGTTLGQYQYYNNTTGVNEASDPKDFLVYDPDESYYMTGTETLLGTTPPDIRAGLLQVMNNMTTIVNSNIYNYDMIGTGNYTPDLHPRRIIQRGNELILLCIVYDFDVTNPEDICVLSIDRTTFAINWAVRYQETTGAIMPEAILDDGSGYVICGMGYLMNISYTGTVNWFRRYTHNNNFISFRSITLCQSCTGTKYIVTGSYQDAGTEKIVTMQTDNLGSVEWSYVHFNTNYHLYANSHVEVAGSNSLEYAITGTAVDKLTGDSSGFLLKLYNPTILGDTKCSNHLLWYKHYTTFVSNQLQQSGLVDIVNGIDNGFAMVGTSKAQLDPMSNAITDVIWMVKTDNNGNSVDDQKYCLTSEPKLDCAEFKISTARYTPTEESTFRVDSIVKTAYIDADFYDYCESKNLTKDPDVGSDESGNTLQRLPSAPGSLYLKNAQQVVFRSEEEQDIEGIELYEVVSGKVVGRMPGYRVHKGDNLIPLQLSHLQSGMYALRVVTHSENIVCILPVVK